MNDRAKQMGRLYVEEGLSYAEIGRRFGISRQRVWSLLRPLDLSAQYGQRRAAERAQRLEAAHARIEKGRSTLRKEAVRLGYKDGESLRGALYRMGLRVRQKPRPLPKHGTRERYARDCRCSKCKAANREWQKRLIGQEPPQHGTESGYRNYACRCKECKEAARLAQDVRRIERRRKKEVLV